MANHIKAPEEASYSHRCCRLSTNCIILKFRTTFKPNMTHHVQTYQLSSSATCFSFHNLASDVNDGLLIVFIYKNTLKATGHYWPTGKNHLLVCVRTKWYALKEIIIYIKRKNFVKVEKTNM